MKDILWWINIHWCSIFAFLYKIQCLQNCISTSAFANISYLMADVEAIFFVYKCTEHQSKCCYWPMLMNIISQMLKISPVFKIRFETCRTAAQFWQNLYMTKKESLPDRRKFCRSGSAVRPLFWRLYHTILLHNIIKIAVRFVPLKVIV